MKFISFFILSLWLVACQKVEPVADIPRYNVYSILNPDEDKISLFIGKLYALKQDIPTDSGKYLPNADVIMRSTRDSIRLIFNFKTKKYEATNKGFVAYNQTYHLTINTPTKERLTAQCKVPAQIQGLTYSESKDSEYLIKLFWQNFNIEETYFRVLGTGISGNHYIPLKWENGATVWEGSSTKKLIESPTGSIENIDKLNAIDLNISISVMDSFYAKYDEQKQKASSQSGTLLERFSQPTTLPSNITNGIGVFGAKINQEIKIKIK